MFPQFDRQDIERFTSIARSRCSRCRSSDTRGWCRRRGHAPRGLLRGQHCAVSPATRSTTTRSSARERLPAGFGADFASSSRMTSRRSTAGSSRTRRRSSIAASRDRRRHEDLALQPRHARRARRRALQHRAERRDLAAAARSATTSRSRTTSRSTPASSSKTTCSCGPSMVFTNVINPAQLHRAQGRSIARRS